MQLYFSLASAEAMQAICDAPLHALGLHYFSYIKVHADGGREVLTTHGIYHAASLREMAEDVSGGYYLWQECNDNKLYQGITFVERHLTVTTFYMFATHAPQSAAIVFCQNNIDLLRRFILYFHDKAQMLIKEAAKHKIHISDFYQPAHNRSNHHLQRQQFLEMTAINKYIIDNQGKRVRLSRREAESAVHMINGYTAKQTARILGLSHRTIEKFNQRVKEKLSYASRAELESVLKDSGIYQAISSK